LLVLLFDPEDGGSTFLQNIGELLPGYVAALHPERWYSSRTIVFPYGEKTLNMADIQSFRRIVCYTNQYLMSAVLTL
jgi:hypothetical protein